MLAEALVFRKYNGSPLNAKDLCNPDLAPACDRIEGPRVSLHMDDKGKTLVMTVVPSTVTEVSYGQDVHRRVGTAIAVGDSPLAGEHLPL